ncbi:MAG: hypothetical protein ACJ0UT_01435 [Candidatus Latescibacterota bacterium]
MVSRLNEPIWGQTTIGVELLSVNSGGSDSLSGLDGLAKGFVGRLRRVDRVVDPLEAVG